MCSDVVHGRALVFDLLSAVDIVGLRVSPLAVILEPKLHIVHDFSFASAGGRTSVNSDTDFFPAPACELGHVLREVLLRVLFLRQTNGRSARIVLFHVDVQEAFRQVLVDPVGRRCSVTLPADAWSWICGCSSGGGIALGIGACWLPRLSTLTPALRFKAPLCPRKGPQPSRMFELPRRGGFRWCRSRVIVALSMVGAAMPGATSSCGTTSMMVFSSRCSGGLMVAVA